ncbi:MAG: hypothetical protein ACREEM_50940, partial [Blastocatellia bacterium]
NCTGRNIFHSPFFIFHCQAGRSASSSCLKMKNEKWRMENDVLYIRFILPVNLGLPPPYTQVKTDPGPPPRLSCTRQPG